MLRKYLVLGIMMGALALTGCEMFEEIEVTVYDEEGMFSAIENKENNNENSNEGDEREETTDLEQINPAEDLYYIWR